MKAKGILLSARWTIIMLYIYRHSLFFGGGKYLYTLLANTQSLRAMAVPRLERNLNLKDLAWDTFYRSEWRVPEGSVPASPSAPPIKMTTLWGELKKQ